MATPPVDLATLTGVRSGKGSYYRAYVRSDERMQQAVRAMDSISRTLVRTLEGPRGLLERVVRAAAAHLAADWAILALSDGCLPGARPRFLAVGPEHEIVDDEDELPQHVRRELGAIRAGHASRTNDDSNWVRVPMLLESLPIGSLVGCHGLSEDPEPGDLSVLRILANQAAVSLHTAEQYQASLALHRRAQSLYDEATARARDLEVRTHELRSAEQRLQVAHQRELLDTERHRIARELHDSVSQYVLSAGMAVEVARGEAEALGDPAGSIVAQLRTAKDLSQEAVDQLRRAIYALHQPHRDTVWSLPELLHEVAEHHRSQLQVTVRIEGDAQTLSIDADHEIARAVGEALFNVAIHADATRAVVRLRYRPHELMVSVADDGTGDPTDLSRRLRLERGPAVDGRHRGLVNIESRVVELGGSLAFRRARLGGVRVELRVPLPLHARDHRGSSTASSGHPAAPPGGTVAILSPPEAAPVADAVGIMLVDDHAIVRQGLRSILEREPDLCVVAEAASSTEALAVIARAHPQIVLLDLKLSTSSDTEGLDLCAELGRLYPELGILVLTTFLDDQLVLRAVRAGARGYVVKDVDTSGLVRAIRDVARGESAFDARSAAAMVRGLNTPQTGEAKKLTTRECEVLRLLARGLSNKDIGERLFISETTVKFHVRNILRKLEVTRRAEAVYEASKAGVI